MKSILTSILLFVCIAPAYAQEADHEQLRAGVWERILARLESLPDRWDALPAPVVPPSGRRAEAVHNAATEAEREAAHILILDLAHSAPAARARLIAQALQQRALSEVDLWHPWPLAQAEQVHDLDQAGLMVEAWLELAEHVGRRDILLCVAGVALYMAKLRIIPARLLAAAMRWSSLPPGPDGSRCAAQVNKAYGSILFLTGHNGQSLDAYRRARLLYQDVGDKLGQGNSWKGEADVLRFLGQNQGALTAYRQARALFHEVGAKRGQGDSWKGEAAVLIRLGWHHDALTAFRQARALFHDVDDKLGQGNSWKGEAAVLVRLGRNHDALTAFRQARLLFHDVGDKLGEGKSWEGEAYVLFRLGRFKSALRAAETAAQLARDVGVLPHELSARTQEARILLAEKQEPRAIERAEDARELLRQWRQKGASDLDRTAMADWSGPYDLLIPLLARKPGPAVEEALALAEEAHAPVLLDLLVTGIRRPEDAKDLSLLDERQRLQHELAELDRRLQDTIASEEREKLRREREAVDAKLEINELRALGSLDSALVNGEPIDTQARNALVEEAGPILLYYVAGNETVAFFLQPGQRAPLVHRIGLSRGRLQDEVRALRHGLANPLWKARAQARQRALFEQLVAPFADALAATPRITIIPHGPLHELPFEALLVDDKTALFERWHVSVAPSLSALHVMRQRRAKRNSISNELAFVGIAGGTGLALSGPAVKDVGAGFGAAVQIVPPGPGSRRAYLEHAPRARHLLVATHGTHVAQSRSGHLELTAPEGHATRLTASEIAQSPLRAELVTLAACETARGEAMLSDERLDLTRAFLIAGADAVLATRWMVPATEPTRLFLGDFYQALREGGPGGTALRKDEALTEARRRSRERGDDAQLWAAWVLVGDAH